MNEKISIHNRCAETRIKGITDWKVPEKVKKDLRRFLEELVLGKVNRGFKISEGRETKYIDLLRTPLEFLNKEIEKIKPVDIELFEKALSKGDIKSMKKIPYAKSTQADIKKAMKIFFRWKIGEAKSIELVGWLDTREVRKTPEFLKEMEIERLYKECKTKWQRYLVAVLFDSGARAEEFHNIRYEDVFLPEEKSNFVKIALKEEYSKTKGRTISLFWKYSLEAVKDYINERIDEGIKPKEQVFIVSYDTARRFLYDLGKKALNKPVHYHLFRHSSATYYADKLNNRQQLCMRYGWAFSSDMPDVYISRAGMDERELDNKFTGTELTKIKDELEKERQSNKIDQEKQQQEIDRLKKAQQKVALEMKQFTLALKQKSA